MNRAERRRRAREIGKGISQQGRKALAEAMKPRPEPESIPGRKLITLPGGLTIVRYDEPDPQAHRDK